jgi:hypothetical protein
MESPRQPLLLLLLLLLVQVVIIVVADVAIPLKDRPSYQKNLHRSVQMRLQHYCYYYYYYYRARRTVKVSLQRLGFRATDYSRNCVGFLTIPITAVKKVRRVNG